MITILHEGDYHCGNLLGLTPPDWQPEQMKPSMSVLWDWREKELKAFGPVDIHVLNGDLTDGPGYKGSMGLFTSNLDDQADIATLCAQRVRLKKGGTRYMTYGSDYHVVASANVERQIARSLGVPLVDTLLFKAGGLRFNFRHFVGRSDIERGQPTQIAREITRALIRQVTDGSEAADIYGRSHVHYWSRVDLGGRTAYTCPAYQLPLDIPGSTYPRRLRTQYYHVGYTLIQIDSHGEFYIRPRYMRLAASFPKEYIEYAPENARTK